MSEVLAVVVQRYYLAPSAGQSGVRDLLILLTHYYSFLLISTQQGVGSHALPSVSLQLCACCQLKGWLLQRAIPSHCKSCLVSHLNCIVVVCRRPHEFKIRCLEDIRSLFPPGEVVAQFPKRALHAHVQGYAEQRPWRMVVLKYQCQARRSEKTAISCDWMPLAKTRQNSGDALEHPYLPYSIPIHPLCIARFLQSSTPSMLGLATVTLMRSATWQLGCRPARCSSSTLRVSHGVG